MYSPTCPPLEIGQSCSDCGGTEEVPTTYIHPGTGIEWKRTGHCNRCGACCSEGDPFDGELGTNIIDGKVVCGLLRKQPNGQFTCSDRASYIYLHGCNVWPQFPDQTIGYDKCSYRFEPVVVEPVVVEPVVT